jgi:O-phosphoseryl-tRNA(Cys) synthetase
MEEIKSALEIAMEKAAEIGGLTAEEKERMKDQEKLNSVLAEFNKGEIDATELWKVLKGEGKPYLLGEAQIKLIESHICPK